MESTNEKFNVNIDIQQLKQLHLFESGDMIFKPVFHSYTNWYGKEKKCQKDFSNVSPLSPFKIPMDHYTVHPQTACTEMS